MSHDIPMKPGYDYLCGVDLLTGEPKGFAFAEGTPKGIAGAMGGSGEIKITKCTSSEDVAKSLNLEVEASARFGLFSADAKFAMADESRLNSYSVFLSAYGSYQAPLETINRPVYSAEAIEMLKRPGGEEEFRRAYGDAFVRGIQTGGEYCALLEITTTSETNKTEISASLEGSYSFNVSAKTELKTKFEKSIQNSRINLHKMQSGGVIQTTKLGTIDAIFSDMEAFFSDIQNTNKRIPYEAICVSYDTVPVPGRPSAIDYKLAAQALELLSTERALRKRQISDINYIIANKDQFEAAGVSESSLAEGKTILLGQVAFLEKEARQVANDLTYTPSYAPPTAMPTIAWPVRKIGAPTPPSAPPDDSLSLGGQGGSKFTLNDRIFAHVDTSLASNVAQYAHLIKPQG